MARCGCASDRCSCNFIAGENIILSGTGTRSNPYVIQAVAQGGGGGGEGSVARLTGEIIAYGGANAPAGWLLCDGSLVDRGAFPDLFGVIGTSYGAGDGMTTFGIPNLSGKFPLGAGGTYARGATGGVVSTVLNINHLPQHNHTMSHTHEHAHSHTIAHTHSISHNHNSTATDGSHRHEIQLDTAVGGGVASVARGSNSPTVGAFVNPIQTASSSHSHAIADYVGTSGGSSAGSSGGASTTTTGQPSSASTASTGSANPTAISTMPPYTAVTYIIKT